MWWVLGFAIIVAVFLIKSSSQKSIEENVNKINNKVDLIYQSDRILNDFLFNNGQALTHYKLCAKVVAALAKDCSESQARNAKTIQALYEEQNRDFEDLLDKVNRDFNLKVNKENTKLEKIPLRPLKNRDFYSFDFDRLKDLEPELSRVIKKRIEEEQLSIKSSLRHLYYDMNNVERILFDKALREVDELKIFHNIIDA